MIVAAPRVGEGGGCTLGLCLGLVCKKGLICMTGAITWGWCAKQVMAESEAGVHDHYGAL